ncbi:hypothetical protein F4861DRAFT_355520 [Xylaria intraflava]|nr:hypothetical protein F4861DRAFT_355520 [Xylaria intraflava]
MAGQRDIARVNWGRAQKIRSDILGKVSSIKKEHGASNYTTRFEEAEGTMAEFRLACMTIIFHDFEYAVEKKVENSLWQCHTFLNGEYRTVLGRLTTSSQVVQRRKLDKLYRGFLKTSEQFYFVYIQQLYNRFTIPELEHIARKAKPQPVEATAENACPAPLRTMVLKSCQMTLVRLGDLARYRCQLSDNFSEATFKTALDYYGLANGLDPDDGSAHHQLAVLHQIPGQHFDIVYHFHRAIAISKPHELALRNLEREFKSPGNPSQARKGPAKDRSQAMVTWFVRLHAFFFHGKHFSQQSELETEVLHRVELALKSENSDNTLLLKMILVNIAAYDISTEKVKSSWTMEGSQSCQFLLRFNLRTMLIVLRALHHTLLDETVTTIMPQGGSNDGESCITFAQGLLKLLPLFRLYLAWIYVTRADLVQYQEYLEPHIKELYGLLADVLTSLNLYIGPTMNTVSSSYLLPEDTEAQGLRPLSDRKLPLFLHVEEQQGSVPPKRVKTRKPQPNVFGRRFKQETEAVWRIRDIICCGAFLAGSAKFPIALTVRNDNSQEVETWVFVDEATNKLSSNEATLSRLLTKLNFGDVKGGSENNTKVEISESRTQSIADAHVSAPENAPRPSIVLSSSASGKGKDSSKPSTTYHDSDLSEDSDMVNMVNRLLDPVDPVDNARPQSSHTQTDTTYDMHSSTANEIFGQVEAGPFQPSPVSKAIPSLPWAYFYKPTPHRSNSLEQNRLSPNTYNIPRSAAGQFDGHTSSSYLDDLSAPYNNQALRLSPRSNTGYLQNSPIPLASSPALPRREYAPDTLERSRSAVLDSLTSALLAQHGLTRNTSSQGKSLNRANTASLWGQQNGTVENQPSQTRDPYSAPEYKHGNTSNYIECPADSHVSMTQSLDPLAPWGQGRPTLGHAVPGTGTSRPSKTMSPATDKPDPQHIWGQGAPDYGQQHSPWLYEPSATGSSLPFSHPSSLITGTPGPVATAPANAVACNGHYYNATTPFGRLGDGVNNRADPTHFRNQLKAAIGTSELSYDQQILQAAMMDNNHESRS